MALKQQYKNLNAKDQSDNVTTLGDKSVAYDSVYKTIAVFVGVLIFLIIGFILM